MLCSNFLSHDKSTFSVWSLSAHVFNLPPPFQTVIFAFEDVSIDKSVLLDVFFFIVICFYFVIDGVK